MGSHFWESDDPSQFLKSPPPEPQPKPLATEAQNHRATNRILISSPRKERGGVGGTEEKAKPKLKILNVSSIDPSARKIYSTDFGL
jgi:hypothetical protein